MLARISAAVLSLVYAGANQKLMNYPTETEHEAMGQR